MRASIPIARPGAWGGRFPSLGWPQAGGLLAALLVSALLGYLAFSRLTAAPAVTVQIGARPEDVAAAQAQLAQAQAKLDDLLSPRAEDVAAAQAALAAEQAKL